MLANLTLFYRFFIKTEIYREESAVEMDGAALVVDASVSLPFLAACIASILGATTFSASASSSPLSVSSSLTQTNSLITSSFNCTFFSDMVCYLLSEWWCNNFILSKIANYVSFYLLFYLHNLFYLISKLDLLLQNYPYNS